ncbi:MAG TPA: protein phosphatase CheZ [Acetobacteraceae bacterium]|nr:protein phosphatase CheZ [Acetobacteraceae bacterium]
MHEAFVGTRAEPLAERIAAIRARYPSAEPEWVADVVRAVITAVQGDAAPMETALLSEVEALGRTIANAKAEIAALQVDDITAAQIPFATDELDAIVAHTAAATNAILESCETLDLVAETLSGEAAGRLQAATTQIYEACSFQDITGQRITKVVTTLKAIEEKVAQIVSTFGQRGAAAAAPVTLPEGEAALLNGPQLPAAAMGQSDIDRLLASFD